MDIIAAAENVVGLYTVRRLNETLYNSQKVCGCRSCLARARAWIDWAAGDSHDLDEALHVPAKWEQLPGEGAVTAG
jgi:hypothetical protein